MVIEENEQTLAFIAFLSGLLASNHGHPYFMYAMSNADVEEDRPLLHVVLADGRTFKVFIEPEILRTW